MSEVRGPFYGTAVDRYVEPIPNNREKNRLVIEAHDLVNTKGESAPWFLSKLSSFDPAIVPGDQIIVQYEHNDGGALWTAYLHQGESE